MVRITSFWNKTSWRIDIAAAIVGAFSAVVILPLAWRDRGETRQHVSRAGGLVCKEAIWNFGSVDSVRTPRLSHHFAFQIDENKVQRDARFDRNWELRTDTELLAEEVALRYKDLLQVENASLTAKSILETRPIYHKCDDTIRGHVFRSFLNLVMMKELQDRMESRG